MMINFQKTNPVFLYILSGVFIIIASSFKSENSVIHYTLGVIGLLIFVLAIIVRFKK
ncbi:hypothetical protein GCM10022271_18870 [Corallibacter vietnamensis]|uniref:Uncharacterized protein n=1 Tax=Corallibacter vietnamensis TaxID=904130 RepID=A0ABP7H6W3_9FLAO